MLDAEPHGEGFALHRHAPLVEHRKAVPGAVAHGHHHLPGGDPAAIGQDHTAHRPVSRIQLQLLHPALEVNLPAGSRLVE